VSKFGTYNDYPKESLPAAEAALLTAWRSLDRYHDDLVLAVTGFIDGADAAVAAFHAEAKAGNTGYEFALKALQKDFSDHDQDGPIRAADFHPGNTGNRDRIRQDVTTVGRILLGV
jgi:hypothetical protein